MASIRNARPLPGPTVLPQGSGSWGPLNIQSYLQQSAPQMAGGAAANPMAQYQTAFEAAKQANESRYQDILGQYQARYSRGMANLEGMGDQSRADINQAYQGRSAQVGQDMVSRGLSGSTIAPTMQMGVERERQGAVGRLDESLRQQRLSTDANLTGDTLGFMERRTDAYPDPNLYMRMAEMQQQTMPAAQGASLYGRATQQTARPQQVRYNGQLYTGNEQMGAYEQVREAQLRTQAQRAGAAGAAGSTLTQRNRTARQAARAKARAPQQNYAPPTSVQWSTSNYGY